MLRNPRLGIGLGVVAMCVWGAVSLPGGADGPSVSGHWRLRVMFDEYGSGSLMLRLDGDSLRGTFTGPPAVRAASGGWAYASTDLAGIVSGDHIEFGFETPQGGLATYTGTIREDSMQGTCDYGEPSAPCTWQAWRRPSVWGL